MAKEEPIQLNDMIADLREQLDQALKEKPKTGLQFELGEIELELKVEITRKISGEASGKLSFNVLGVGAEIGAGGEKGTDRSQAHTFKIKLNPVFLDQQGKYWKALVSDEVKGPDGGPPARPGSAR